jgi:hypothetical protein
MVEMDASIVEDADDFICVCCGVSFWTDIDGLLVLEEDFRVAGEVWRVHKSDPYPSRPHAHSVGGSRRFVGCKLHLGTRQLFAGTNKPVDRYLERSQFDRLIALIRPKFPNIILPLAV